MQASIVTWTKLDQSRTSRRLPDIEATHMGVAPFYASCVRPRVAELLPDEADTQSICLWQADIKRENRARGP